MTNETVYIGETLDIRDGVYKVKSDSRHRLDRWGRFPLILICRSSEEHIVSLLKNAEKSHGHVVVTFDALGDKGDNDYAEICKLVINDISTEVNYGGDAVVFLSVNVKSTSLCYKDNIHVIDLRVDQFDGMNIADLMDTVYTLVEDNHLGDLFDTRDMGRVVINRRLESLEGYSVSTLVTLITELFQCIDNIKQTSESGNEDKGENTLDQSTKSSFHWPTIANIRGIIRCQQSVVNKKAIP